MKEGLITTSRRFFSEKCPICNKEIRAFSESHLEYNKRLHKEKHKGDKKK